MANYLSMAQLSSIETLHRSGHSNREIARLLQVDRGTVNKYVGRLKVQDAQNQPNPLTGSSGEEEASAVQNRPNVRTGSDGGDSAGDGSWRREPPGADPPQERGGLLDTERSGSGRTEQSGGDGFAVNRQRSEELL